MSTRGFTLWFTGLPGSGKSTISKAVYKALVQGGMTRCELLDGDVVRTHISKGLGFSKEDRDTNILRIGWVTQLLTKHGVPNLVAAVSPYQEARRQVRAMVEEAGGPGSFIEVYVKCPLKMCEKRDPKGLYEKARRGEISGVTGVDDPYEEPEKPDIILDTTVLDVRTEIRLVMQELESRGLLSPITLTTRER